jgi:hypothetical protein
MADLKHCPACGADAQGPTREGGSDERMGYNFTVRVTCSGCGLTISRGSHQGKAGWCDDTGQAESEVVKAWNTRRDSAPPMNSKKETT